MSPFSFSNPLFHTNQPLSSHNMPPSTPVHADIVSCGCCLSSSSEPTLSYAMVLAFGTTDIKSISSQLHSTAIQSQMPCFSAYCSKCAKQTWIATESSLSSSLIAHKKNFHNHTILSNIITKYTSSK